MQQQTAVQTLPVLAAMHISASMLSVMAVMAVSAGCSSAVCLCSCTFQANVQQLAEPF